MTYLNNGRGTFVLDRRYKGVGRIKKSTGTNDVKTFQKLVGMMDTLEDSGRIDLLKDMRDNVVSILEVWEHYRTQNLENIPSSNSIKLLDPAVFKWVDGFEVTEGTKRSYRNNFRQLLKTGTSKSTLEDLPELLQKYRKHCQIGGNFRAFNHTRATVQSFLRDELGKYSHLWAEISDIKTLPSKRKRDGQPKSVMYIDGLIQRMPKKYGDMVWALCTTGMGWTDYTGTWSTHKTFILIEGTKNKNRVRKIPRISDPVRPATTEQYVRKAIKKATKDDLQIYDFRRTYSHWMELSGIPRSRRQTYMGHRSRDVLDLYEAHEVDSFLVEDGKRLKEYIADQRASRK